MIAGGHRQTMRDLLPNKLRIDAKSIDQVLLIVYLQFVILILGAIQKITKIVLSSTVFLVTSSSLLTAVWYIFRLMSFSLPFSNIRLWLHLFRFLRKFCAEITRSMSSSIANTKRSCHRIKKEEEERLLKTENRNRPSGIFPPKQIA